MPYLELRREIPAKGCLGEYVHHLGLIRLHPGMPRRQARSVLCHELQHARFADVPTFDRFITARQELRADTNAARLLIDVHDLGDALLEHDQHLPATAVALHVSLVMVNVRLKQLHPSERHYLSRFFGDHT